MSSPVVASKRAAATSANKLAGLELLRFGAAFTVLIAHYNHFFIYKYDYVHFVRTAQPFFRPLALLYGYGTRAVEVFWCLSGFIFFYKYAAVIGAKAISFRRFAVLRFSRLYPLHVATLLAVTLLQWLYWRQNGAFYVVELNNLKHFLLNLGFASAWGFESGFSFNSPVWSVSVEVLAYVFFFLVTYYLSADAMAVALCLAGCWAATYFGGHESVIVRCIFYFYLGGLSCLIYRSIGSLRRKSAAVAAALAVGAVTGAAVQRFIATGEVSWILDLGVPGALASLAWLSRWIPAGLARGFDFAGNLTYASYLLHFPTQIAVMLVVQAAGIDRHFAYAPGFFVCYLLWVFGLAALVYRRFELPAQQWIRQRGLKRS